MLTSAEQLGTKAAFKLGRCVFEGEKHERMRELWLKFCTFLSWK